MLCEMCGKESDMDFNCFLPTFGLMLEVDICFECFGNGSSDLEVAAKVIKKRCEDRKIETPIPMPEGIPTLASVCKRKTDD